MFFLIEQVIAVVLALIVVITLAIVIMVVVAVQRRQVRERFFERLDRVRQEYAPVVAAVLSGALDHRRAIGKLQLLAGRERMVMLERLCLEAEPTPEQLPALRRLSEDLGLVEFWQQRLRQGQERVSFWKRLFSLEGLLGRLGRMEFVTRAQSAENLGAIRHQPSWPLLVQALRDPHPDVQAVSVHALALIGEPQSFPALVERLQAVILEPSTAISLRAVKTAVVSFPLSLAPALSRSLQHPHRRIRFLATDVIREMVEREAAPSGEATVGPVQLAPELAEMFLTRLCADENPDVRARTAPILAHMADPRAIQVLLALLEDREWFVRLHAVRALAKPKFALQVDAIAQRLTDRHWMVRESAVHTLQQLERLEHLYDVFLHTQDRYSQEQIADEWQRVGVIPALLGQYAQANSGPQGRVVGQLISMGKTSYMLAVLTQTTDRNLRKRFLEDFGRSPDPQIQYWVRELARREPDKELRALALAAKLPERP